MITTYLLRFTSFPIYGVWRFDGALHLNLSQTLSSTSPWALMVSCTIFFGLPGGYPNHGCSQPDPWIFLDPTLRFSLPTLGFSRPDPLVFTATLGVFSAQPLFFSRPGPRVFCGRLSGFSRPAPRSFLGPPLGVFSARPSEFSQPAPRSFLSPFLWVFSAQISVFLAFARLLIGCRCPPLRVYSSHAGLCGCDCPRVVLSSLSTSPGPWFPYLLRPGILRIFIASALSCSPLHGFLWPPFPV